MSGAEDTSLSPARWAAAGNAATPAGAPPRRRLFRKYALLFIALVGAALLINSAFDFWFSYQENKAALVRIQQEKAEAAARRIEEFIGEIEHQIGWTTHAQWASGPLDQRRQDYFRLQRQEPPITELTELDGQGKECLTVSRLKMEVVPNPPCTGADFSQNPAFTEARANRIWFSPVYFRKESEPYMTLAMAREGRKAGVTVAEINLKLIWDVITGLKISQSGYAYVVDEHGRLIAHPDISLVLRDTDLSKLPQVAAALAADPDARGDKPAATVAQNLAGRSVLTAHSAIAPVGWRVFVEVPLAEAFAPLYGAASRTAGLLLFGLIAATLVALVIARRMTGPIRAIAAGAERIGAGELDRRIEIHTGDELEALAEQFNRMGADLQKSYAELEQRVADRTAELSEALDQQTATAEVLGVISNSLTDTQPVFDAIVQSGLKLFPDAAISVALPVDDQIHAVAVAERDPARAEAWRRRFPVPLTREYMHSAAILDQQVIDIPDVRDAPAEFAAGGQNFLASGYRGITIVPMRRGDAAIGALSVVRRAPGPLSDEQLAVLKTFASQAVIAIENARLMTETREALEQQTATAEVLGVINSSPGDLAPVFDAMLEKAVRLCDAHTGHLVRYQDGVLSRTASFNVPDEFDRLLPLNAPMSDAIVRNSVPARMIAARSAINVPDLREDASYRAGALAETAAVNAGIRAALYVPLLKDREVVGAFIVHRLEARAFTDKEIALLHNFAAQAVIAMENARLITETREALEQQTATAEVLGVINSSPGDLAPVFDAMLEKAMRLCGADEGALRTFDGSLFHLVAARGDEPDVIDRLRQLGPIRGEGPIFGRFVLGERVVSIADMRETEAYRDYPVARERIEVRGIRSWLGVALHKEDVVLGVMIIHRKQVLPFSDKQIALLRNFAAQAVIAMENARLITETREALDQQTATAEVLGVINSSPGDLAPVFDAMLDKAMRLCEAAFGFLALFESGTYRTVAQRNLPEGLAEFLKERHPISPNGSIARLVQGESLIQFVDISTDELTPVSNPGRRALVDSGARTTIWVALRKDGATLGVFNIYRQEVRAFTDKQIALLQNFAAQAVIAIENVRLITETREALDQQTATAEVLGVINSSPGDLAPVFDAMLDKALNLCSADYGVLWIRDGDVIRTAAIRGAMPDFTEFLLRERVPVDAEMMVARAVRERSVIHVLDAKDSEPYRRGVPLAVFSADRAGIRTILMVPLSREGEGLGLLTIYRREVRPFTEKQIALLQNFAAQAVIAMENARLITETQEALDQQTATAEVLQVINSSPGDLAPVFDAMLDKAARLCEALYGQLYTWDGERFCPVAVHGEPSFVEWMRQRGPVPGRRPDGSAPLPRIARGERVVHVPDVLEDAAYRAGSGNSVWREQVQVCGTRSVLTVALRKDEALLGALTVYRKEPRPFSDKQIALLQNFAAQAVIAMENARLITETREALEQQTATAEVLGVINSSPGDLAPVFEAMLEKATRLCEAPCAIFWAYDGDRFQPAAFKVPEALAEFLRGNPGVGPSLSLNAIERGEAYVHSPDLLELHVGSTNPLSRAVVDLGGGRTGLLVPLVKDGTLLGAIRLFRQEVRPFTDKQIALLQNFAAQAVIAMENARLITETREALDRQTATAEVLGVINSSPGDLGPVFDSILEKAHTLCGAEHGTLTVRDGGGQFRTVASRNLPESFAIALREPFGVLPNSPTDRLQRGEPLIHIHDATAGGQHWPDTPRSRASRAAGVRTLLFVPLRKDSALLGYITAYRREVRPFTDKQIALLQNFAAQAVIAMENARLITETREALDQQTATAEVLGVINSSPGDLAPVFDAMLDKALALCGAAQGTLRTFDGEKLVLAAVRGDPNLIEGVRRLGPIVPRPGIPFEPLFRGQRVVQISDIRETEGYRNIPATRERADLGGIRTWLAVALHKGGALLGSIAVYRREVRPFLDKEIALLENFAAQAVIAMENARLMTETREALDQQTATAEVLGVINASPGDLAPVFDAMLEKATRLCEAVHGQLAIYDGEFFRFVAVHGGASFVEEQYALGLIPASFGVTWPRIVSGESVVHIADVKDTELYHTGHERTRRFVDIGGGRSLVTVALRKDDALLGALTVYRQELRPFSDKQIALLQNFAAQAVIAMENARLITETREALDQQTATAEVLQVINSSPGDLAPVFEAMLEKAMRLCEAAFGQLNTYEGRFHTVAMRGVPAPLTEFRKNNPPDYGPGTGPARVLAGERVVHTIDLKEGAPYQAGEPNRRALVDLGGARTSLLLPLLKEEAVLGTIMIYRQEVRAFSDKQIALLQNFAAQAVIAMENARLLTELQDRTHDLQESLEYQTATSDVLKVISQSTFDLQPVLDTLVETAARLCDAGYGAIFRRDGEVYRMATVVAFSPETIAAARNFQEFLERHPLVPGRGSTTGRVALEGRAVQIADTASDSEYTLAEATTVGTLRTQLGVPLLRAGELIGVIVLARHRVDPFTEKQIELVTTFADQAVIAIENARLLGELRSRTDELARSVEELKALGEVGQEVSSTLELRAVLVTILNRSVSLTGSDAGAIFRYSRAERAFHFVEAIGWDAATVSQVRDLSVGETVTALGDAIAKRAPLQIADLRTRPANPLRDSSLAAGYRSALIVPLVGADRIMGVTILQRRVVGEFPEASVRLMQTLASQSVLAIQNARLFREIADKSEELAQASEHKSQFLANMSHELRTPLNAILGYTELMVDGIYGDLPPRAAGVLERVQNNGKHLLALINDVLDLAKIEAGQLTLTLEDFAMPDVVQSVVSATEGLANTKGLKFTADIMPGLPQGRGDARRLSQVLLNLVGNAVKFTDAGEVAIGALAENGNFVLTVRDTGPGIAAEDQDRIFGEFQQIDNSNTRKKGGTGLGLAISKRMVEMQGGTISVESALGQGATFRVTLPIRVEGGADELTGELMGAA